MIEKRMGFTIHIECTNKSNILLGEKLYYHHMYNYTRYTCILIVLCEIKKMQHTFNAFIVEL